MLEVNNIHVFYGLFEVLKGVSLTVGEGETVGLLGPNGHGKSTIINTISGILVPHSGTIKFDRSYIHQMPPHKIVEIGIVQVPEGRKLFPEMTVLENLKMGAYTSHAWKEKDKNLEKAFDLFPMLKEKKDQKCLTLSGGERQAVALARGLMSSAKLLMLDEPSMGLAPKLAKEVLEKIKEIKKSGVSILLVEQNVLYITDVADRMYLIEQGKVALEGKRDMILSNKYVKEAYLGVF